MLSGAGLFFAKKKIIMNKSSSIAEFWAASRPFQYLSIAIILGICVTIAVGAYKCGRSDGAVEYEQWLSVEHRPAQDKAFIVGSADTGWPYWRVEAIWRQTWRAWPGEDHVGPVAYEFYYPVQPTRQVVDSLMSVYLPGNWRVARLHTVKMLRPGYKEPLLEEAPPKKD